MISHTIASVSIISIHALLAEGDVRPGAACPRSGSISIHALLAEGDSVKASNGRGRAISIHALLAEGDQQDNIQLMQTIYFNPRPPRGGRRYLFCVPGTAQEFQSTPSSRRATGGQQGGAQAHDISIHALLAEGDRCLR